MNATAMRRASAWTTDHVAALEDAVYDRIPLIRVQDVHDIVPGLMFWDSWPVQTADGRTAILDGWELWVMMCAPRDVYPDARHHIARLRLLMKRGGEWRDCGLLLPDGLNPGAREWAGSTVLDSHSGAITLFFTAAGRRGDDRLSYEQRLFQTTGRLEWIEGEARVFSWSDPVESVASDGIIYCRADQQEGRPGFIKAFRDPCHFRDPADGADYLLFTASLGTSESDFNGAIGIARADGEGFTDWQLLPPLISADGVNNELERPVMRYRNGLYYCFWSTQRRTFAPDEPAGPNGLYGMVADSLFGDYRPLNGTGLVAANPDAEPLQAYSWWVTDTFGVAGFVDHWGLEGRSLGENPDLAVSQFGGVPAPLFHIALDGDRAGIVQPGFSSTF